MLFSDEVLQKLQVSQKKWEEDYAKFYGDTKVEHKSSSGFDLKPVYTPLDIKDMDFEDMAMPGVYPHLRGTYPLQYQIYPWASEFGFGYGLPEDTRQRYDLLIEEGMKGHMGRLPIYFIVGDTALTAGYDPNYPQARGYVGRSGNTWSTMHDLEILFDGLPLDKMNVLLPACAISGVPVLAQYIAYVQRRGIPLETLRGLSHNYWYRHISVDCAHSPPEGAFMNAVEIIKYCTKNMPKWNTMTISSYMIEEAGATPLQDLAFMLSTYIFTAERCIEVGLNPDDFAHRFGNFFGMGNDFFEQIAKIRAYKRMWAKINKERFGCKKPRALKPVIQLQTAGSTFTAQQPLNNVVRATLQTLACVLSGSDSMWTSAYDEALAVPTEEAVTLALRTQHIILHESNITAVSDPLGGSFYLEWLTNKLEEEAYKLIEKIEKMGYLNCLRDGWFRKEIERSAYETRQAIKREEKIVVGLNKYEGGKTLKAAPLKVDPKVEKIAIERIKKFREQRDNNKTRAALEQLREVAKRVKKEWPDGPDLLPAAIEAADANATMGEMSDIMKEVYGWGYTYGL